VAGVLGWIVGIGAWQFRRWPHRCGPSWRHWRSRRGGTISGIAGALIDEILNMRPTVRGRVKDGGIRSLSTPTIPDQTREEVLGAGAQDIASTGRRRTAKSDKPLSGTDWRRR
jgi:hypothetical protein